MKKGILSVVLMAATMMLSQSVLAADFIGGGVGMGFGRFNLVPNISIDYAVNSDITINGWMGLQLNFGTENNTTTDFMATVFGKYDFIDQNDLDFGIQVGANLASSFTLAVGPFVSYEIDSDWTVYADGSIGLLTTGGNPFERSTITAGAQYDVKNDLAVRAEYRMINGKSMFLGSVGYLF